MMAKPISPQVACYSKSFISHNKKILFGNKNDLSGIELRDKKMQLKIEIQERNNDPNLYCILGIIYDSLYQYEKACQSFQVSASLIKDTKVKKELNDKIKYLESLIKERNKEWVSQVEQMEMKKRDLLKAPSINIKDKSKKTVTFANDVKDNVSTAIAHNKHYRKDASSSKKRINIKDEVLKGIYLGCIFLPSREVLRTNDFRRFLYESAVNAFCVFSEPVLCIFVNLLTFCQQIVHISLNKVKNILSKQSNYEYSPNIKVINERAAINM